MQSTGRMTGSDFNIFFSQWQSKYGVLVTTSLSRCSNYAGKFFYSNKSHFTFSIQNNDSITNKFVSKIKKKISKSVDTDLKEINESTPSQNKYP